MAPAGRCPRLSGIRPSGIRCRGRNVRTRFLPAVTAGLGACLPLVLAGAAQARDQIGWIARSGLHLTAFAFFGRNLFYSTSAAAALIVLALLAWAVAWREAAFLTALAIGPVAAVWLVSQGSYSYFFPRYLLFTVGAWALLAGIELSPCSSW